MFNKLTNREFSNPIKCMRVILTRQIVAKNEHISNVKVGNRKSSRTHKQMHIAFFQLL